MILKLERKKIKKLDSIVYDIFKIQLEIIEDELSEYKSYKVSIEKNISKYEHGTAYISFEGTKRKTGKKYLLRINISNNFPLEAPSYIFVDPVTRKSNLKVWPRGKGHFFGPGTIFKEGWICLDFTNEYQKVHSNTNWDPNLERINLKGSLMKIIDLF